jgi:hypothetical protein
MCLGMLALHFFPNFVGVLLAVETDSHIEHSHPESWAFRIHNYFIVY